MSETTKKPAPRRSRAKPKTAPKARSDAGAPLCAVFTAGPTTIRTGPGRGFEAAGEAAAGDWLLALPAKDGWSEVAAVAGHTYGSDGTLDEGAPVIAMPRRAGWCPVATFLGGRFVTGFVPAAAIKGR